MLNPAQFSNSDPLDTDYTAPNGKVYALRNEGGRQYTASTPGGRRVGLLSAYGGPEPEDHTIHQIKVSGPHQRKGVGGALLDFARRSQPDLHHSSALTDDGKGYAAGTPVPWQPKLGSSDMQGDLSASRRNSMNWKQYIDHGPKNARTNQEYEARTAARENPRTAGGLGIQRRLF